MKLKTKHFHILLVIILSFIIYSNTFFNPFIFDDQFFIVDNFEIRSLKNIPSYFSEPSVGNLYRPVRSVFYSITFFFWRFNPFGYHLNAILLHTSISILVYLIASKIFSDKHLPLVISLLFVAHPIHTERVANMTAGFDLLGILFLFWAFYNYIIFRKYNSKKAFTYSVILFILGLFSSEEVITFPILALLYDFCFVDKVHNFTQLGKCQKSLISEHIGNKRFPMIPNFPVVEKKEIFNANNVRSKIRYFWVYITFLLFYLIVRFSVLQQIGRAEVYFFGNLQTRILSTLIIFLRYIYILIWPLNLTVDYYVDVYKSFFSLNILLAIFIYLIIIFFWVKSYKDYKIVFFSIGCFFITLIPFSNIFPVYFIMADRYLYVASFGFVLLLTYLLGKILDLKSFNKNILMGIYVFLTLFLIVFYFSITIARNRDWKSDYTLFLKATERQPKSSIAHNDLGQVYQEMGFYDKAFNEYKGAIILNNKNHIAWLNLGSLYLELGNYSEAVYSINKSLSIFESYKAHNNLGLIYDRMGEQEKAIFELKKAIEFNPSLSKAYMDLGVIYAKIGEFDMALQEFDRAIKINPNIADIHYNLGVLYTLLNQTDNAREEFNIAYKQITSEGR